MFDLWIRPSESALTFQVKTQDNAVVMLSPSGKFEQSDYELNFGANNNTETVLKQIKDMEILSRTTTKDLLNNNSFTGLWVNWYKERTIGFGRGFIQDRSIIDEWSSNTSNSHIINEFSFSSRVLAEWILLRDASEMIKMPIHGIESFYPSTKSGIFLFRSCSEVIVKLRNNKETPSAMVSWKKEVFFVIHFTFFFSFD